MLGYGTILGTAGLGYFGAPWWSLLSGAALLAGLAIWDLQPLRSGLTAVGASHVAEGAGYARIGHSVLAAIAAFTWGTLVRLLLA